MWLFERPIAHRGLHNENDTENSMSAFRNAIEKGYNIETDVHILKSGEVVIFHDDNLNRVCKKNVKIADLTLDDIKGDDYLLPNGEHIPLLTDLLEIVDGNKTGILLELKLNGFNYNLEKATYPIIKGKESYIAVQAFNPWTVAWFNHHAPEFYHGLLSMPTLLPIGKLMMRKMAPNFLAFDIKGLTKGVISYCEKKNMNVLSWTINTPEYYNKALELTVNNIIFEKLNLYELGFSVDKCKKPF